MKVRLTKKYAERIDGVDLRGRNVGDLLDLSPPDAHVLCREAWATPERRRAPEPTNQRRRASDYPGSADRIPDE